MGIFKKNFTKCYKVPIKSVTSGVYIFRYYMLRLLRGVGGPPCYCYKALQSGGGAIKLALHRGCNRDLKTRVGQSKMYQKSHIRHEISSWKHVNLVPFVGPELVRT